MKCRCSIFQKGYGLKEWDQEFDALPRKGDMVIGSGISCFVDYCVHKEGELIRITMEGKG